jgi:hypothetical protein
MAIAKMEPILKFDLGTKMIPWRQRQSLCRSLPTRSRQTGELPTRRHRFGADCTAPVPEIRLQRRHLHPVWRELPERVGGVAILLAGKTQLRCPWGRRRSKMLDRKKVGSKRETIATHW